jgi:hypothetical protein
LQREHARSLSPRRYVLAPWAVTPLLVYHGKAPPGRDETGRSPAVQPSNLGWSRRWPVGSASFDTHEHESGH